MPENPAASGGQGPHDPDLPDTVRPLRRDAERNRQRILKAASEVFNERGLEVSLDEIARYAGVGVGTVYRRFASKDALIDELLRLATQELIRDAEHALARTDGYGLHELLRAFGRSFAEHARYANLLLRRQPDASAASKLRQAVSKLTSRAVSAGTVNQDITTDDVITLVSAMRGLIHTVPGGTPDAWQRFLDIHLAGMTHADGTVRGAVRPAVE